MPQRERLNRDRVLRVAVSLADAEGLESLSMRRLAQELGVVPMALYKHVADKEALLDGMVDLVFGEVDVPVGTPWRDALRDRSVSMREALRRHPWAVGRMESGTPGPANLRNHDAVLGCLRDGGGFSLWDAVHALSVLDSYVYGFALQERAVAGDIPAEAERRLDVVTEREGSPEEEYPYLAELVATLSASGYDYAEEFAFGLDLVLDGLERLQQSNRAGRPRRTP